MTFLSLNLEHLRLPEFLGENPVNRATWLCLTAYCATIENSGRIAGCRNWKTRMWEQCCGVTRDEVMTDSELWKWDGDDLLVWNYPQHLESNMQTKRSNGKFGHLGGRPRKNPPENPVPETGSSTQNPVSETGVTPKLSEAKLSEAKRTKKEEDDASAPAPDSDSGQVESETCLDTYHAVRFLNPIFGHPADMIASSQVMESAHRTFAAGVAQSRLDLIQAFYCSAPDFRNRSSWHSLHEDDPRRFRKFKLAHLIDEFADQIAHADRWHSGAWKQAGAEDSEPQKKEKDAPPKLPPFPWRKVAAVVLQWSCVPPADEFWFDLEPDLKRQVIAAWRSLSPEVQASLSRPSPPASTTDA